MEYFINQEGLNSSSQSEEAGFSEYKASTSKNPYPFKNILNINSMDNLKESNLITSNIEFETKMEENVEEINSLVENQTYRNSEGGDFGSLKINYNESNDFQSSENEVNDNIFQEINNQINIPKNEINTEIDTYTSAFPNSIEEGISFEEYQAKNIEAKKDENYFGFDINSIQTQIISTTRNLPIKVLPPITQDIGEKLNYYGKEIYLNSEENFDKAVNLPELNTMEYETSQSKTFNLGEIENLEIMPDGKIIFENTEGTTFGKYEEMPISNETEFDVNELQKTETTFNTQIEYGQNERNEMGLDMNILQTTESTIDTQNEYKQYETNDTGLDTNELTVNDQNEYGQNTTNEISNEIGIDTNIFQTAETTLNTQVEYGENQEMPISNETEFNINGLQTTETTLNTQVEYGENQEMPISNETEFDINGLQTTETTLNTQVEYGQNETNEMGLDMNILQTTESTVDTQNEYKQFKTNETKDDTRFNINTFKSRERYLDTQFDYGQKETNETTNHSEFDANVIQTSGIIFDDQTQFAKNKTNQITNEMGLNLHSLQTREYQNSTKIKTSGGESLYIPQQETHLSSNLEQANMYIYKNEQNNTTTVPDLSKNKTFFRENKTNLKIKENKITSGTFPIPKISMTVETKIPSVPAVPPFKTFVSSESIPAITLQKIDSSSVATVTPLKGSFAVSRKNRIIGGGKKIYSQVTI